VITLTAFKKPTTEWDFVVESHFQAFCYLIIRDFHVASFMFIFCIVFLLVILVILVFY